MQTQGQRPSKKTDPRNGMIAALVVGLLLGGAFVASALYPDAQKLHTLQGQIEKERAELKQSNAQIADLNVSATKNEDLISNSKQCWESLTQARAQLILYMGNNSSQRAEIDSLKGQVEQVRYLPAPALPQQITAATILYEPQSRELAGTGIPLAHGMLELRLGLAAGPAISARVPQELGGMQPRWYVPGKVIPTFLGNPGATQIFFFDFATQRMDGPYQPQYTSARQ